jgi:preprotein translocase subunit SecY
LVALFLFRAIIMQLMTAVSPQLEQLKKEGEAGRRKISQYTRYLTVALALVQAIGMSIGLAGQGVAFTGDFGFHFVAVTTFVAGAMFMMWLGEQITERGVGNGISMLIFAGIVAGLPRAIGQSFESARQGDINIFGKL